MIANRESLLPPNLISVAPLLKSVPRSLHGWIAEKHVQYLDNRIHKIDRLTDYLANCSQVDRERKEFMAFVVDWTQKANPDLTEYLRQYRARFSSVRSRVEELCDDFLARANGVRLDSHFLNFWRSFSEINELDSVHGMFLTSGRWHVNVMLPPVKELIFCFLAGQANVHAALRNDLAYHVARRVITPRFAETPADYDHSYERKFATLFMQVLQHFDRKLCFLFELFAQIPNLEFLSIGEFTTDVATNPARYELLLCQGVYPPFGWHELLASRKSRRPSKALGEAAAPLFSVIPPDFHERARVALDCLSILKEYELNYNNYNYKGRFGLVSKYQYWVTSQLLNEGEKQEFLDAILLDRFFDALAVVEQSTTQEQK